jgi:hypothetical protein
MVVIWVYYTNTTLFVCLILSMVVDFDFHCHWLFHININKHVPINELSQQKKTITCLNNTLMHIQCCDISSPSFPIWIALVPRNRPNRSDSPGGQHSQSHHHRPTLNCQLRILRLMINSVKVKKNQQTQMMNEYKRLEGTRQNGVIFSHHQYSSSLYPHLTINSHSYHTIQKCCSHLHHNIISYHITIPHHSQWPPSLNPLSSSPLPTPSKPHTTPPYSLNLNLTISF